MPTPISDHNIVTPFSTSYGPKHPEPCSDNCFGSCFGDACTKNLGCFSCVPKQLKKKNREGYRCDPCNPCNTCCKPCCKPSCNPCDPWNCKFVHYYGYRK